MRRWQRTDDLRVSEAVTVRTNKDVCPIKLTQTDTNRYDLTFVTYLPKLQQLTSTPRPLMLRPSDWRPKPFRLRSTHEVPDVP